MQSKIHCWCKRCVLKLQSWWDSIVSLKNTYSRLAWCFFVLTGKRGPARKHIQRRRDCDHAKNNRCNPNVPTFLNESETEISFLGNHCPFAPILFLLTPSGLVTTNKRGMSVMSVKCEEMILYQRHQKKHVQERHSGSPVHHQWNCILLWRKGSYIRVQTFHGHYPWAQWIRLIRPWWCRWQSRFLQLWSRSPWCILWPTWIRFQSEYHVKFLQSTKAKRRWWKYIENKSFSHKKMQHVQRHTRQLPNDVENTHVYTWESCPRLKQQNIGNSFFLLVHRNSGVFPLLYPTFSYPYLSVAAQCLLEPLNWSAMRLAEAACRAKTFAMKSELTKAYEAVIETDSRGRWRRDCKARSLNHLLQCLNCRIFLWLNEKITRGDAKWRNLCELMQATEFFLIYSLLLDSQNTLQTKVCS